jgi:CheY-like chemotaxis protein
LIQVPLILPHVLTHLLLKTRRLKAVKITGALRQRRSQMILRVHFRGQEHRADLGAYLALLTPVCTVRGLAEAHGGTLVANSDGHDFGSTFLLTMQTTVPNERSSTDAGQDGQTQRRIGLRILLVDDHPDTCAALEKLLVRRGHLVATAHSIRSAMEAAVVNRFDLLISDIALSDGSGIDLMTQLHRICGLPGIAMSGFGMKGDIERIASGIRRTFGEACETRGGN